MALINLDALDLQIIQLALSKAKFDLMRHDGEPTPGIDLVAAKVNSALIEEQKDIDFEKRRNAINQN